MPSIQIGLKSSAYTPEAYAYASHLAGKGWAVHLRLPDKPGSISPDIDLRFMGMDLAKETKEGLRVHEYHSLSVPPYARIKDRLKRSLNSRPAGRIFLSPYVENRFGFDDDVPFLYRDMGVDRTFFIKPEERKRDFDVVYCGSLNARSGLVETLIRLGRMGLKVLVIGAPSDDVFRRLRAQLNITLAGRLGREVIPAAMADARIGLNYTPNCYPFNQQTSTKTLEYCAAGLGVLSNRYTWAERFSAERGARFCWLDGDVTAKEILDFNYRVPDVADLEWDVLLEKAGLHTFLKELVG